MLATALLSACATAPPPATRWSLVVHGGAGVIERANLTPEVEAQYRAAMQRALNTGGAILDRGGSRLKAAPNSTPQSWTAATAAQARSLVLHARVIRSAPRALSWSARAM
jgi:hypothetical protein